MTNHHTKWTARILWQAAVTGCVAACVAAVPATATAASMSKGKNRAAVTVTVWNDLNQPPPGLPASKYWFNAAVKLFNQQNPGIHVKLVQAPTASSTAFETLLRTSEVAGNTPDIAGLFAGGQILQNDSYLLNLNKYLTPQFKKSLFIGWQWATAGFHTSGPVYGVPYGAGYWYFVYYNKALMKKAGATITEQSYPRTWPQLVALARKVKAAGITPFFFGEKEGYFGAWTQDALISGLVGTEGVLQMYRGQLSLDSTPMIRAYEAWHELYADGLTNSDAPELSANNAPADFAAGKGAMTITGGFNNEPMASMGSNVGIFPVPTLPGSKYPNVLSGGPNNDWVIFKNAKNVPQAVKFVKFLVSPKVQEMAIGQLGQLPDNTSYAPSASLAETQPLLAQAYYYIRVRHYVLAEAWDNVLPGSIDSYWYQTNNGVFSGSLGPKQAAASLETQMKNYLATQKAGG